MKLRSLLTTILINTCALSSVWGSSIGDERLASAEASARPSFMTPSHQPTDEPQTSSVAPAALPEHPIDGQQESSSLIIPYTLATLPDDALSKILFYVEASTQDFYTMWRSSNGRFQQRLAKLVDTFAINMRNAIILPTNLPVIFPNLRILDLSRNMVRVNLFGSTLPHDQRDDTSLKKVHFMRKVTPLIVPILPQLQKLEELNISSAHFNAQILPREIILLSNLTKLNLNGCNLTTLSNLPNPQNLTELDVSYNQFAGGILPPEISQLTRLKTLRMHESGLTIPFPPRSLSLLTNLIHLDIGSNRFAGVFPVPILSLTQLESLSMGDIGVTTLPNNFSQLQPLTQLDVSWNIFSGALPPTITLLTRLTALNISNCGITTFPQELSQLQELNYLKAFNDGAKNRSFVLNAPLPNLKKNVNYFD